MVEKNEYMYNGIYRHVALNNRSTTPLRKVSPPAVMTSSFYRQHKISPHLKF